MTKVTIDLSKLHEALDVTEEVVQHIRKTSQDPVVIDDLQTRCYWWFHLLDEQVNKFEVAYTSDRFGRDLDGRGWIPMFISDPKS